MKLSRAVQEFLSEGRTYLSPATLAAYESDLGRLAALVSPYSVLGFTPDVVRAYFLGLSNQNRRMATLFYRKHSALQEFGRLGVRKAFWIRNPMEEIQHPPKPQHLPRPFAPEEMRRIMQLELPPIERVIRAVLYYTGLRVIPICALKVGDLSFDEMRPGAELPATPVPAHIRDGLAVPGDGHSPDSDVAEITPISVRRRSIRKWWMRRRERRC